MMFYDASKFSPVVIEENIGHDTLLTLTVEGERIAELEELIEDVGGDIEFILGLMVTRAYSLKNGLDCKQVESFVRDIRRNLKRFGG